MVSIGSVCIEVLFGELVGDGFVWFRGVVIKPVEPVFGSILTGIVDVSLVRGGVMGVVWVWLLRETAWLLRARTI